MTVEEIERFWFGRVYGGNAKGGAGGRPEGFGVPGIGRAGQQKNASCSEGLGRAHEGADVAGVLQTGEDENQRGRACEQSFHGKGRWVDKRGDALGLLGGDGAREDIGWEQERFGVVGKCKGRLVALAQEDGGKAEMAANGFGDEVLTFNGDEAGGGSPSAGECGAQLFDARVLTAFDEAEARVQCADGHRGDFTLPGGASPRAELSTSFHGCRDDDSCRSVFALFCASEHFSFHQAQPPRRGLRVGNCGCRSGAGVHLLEGASHHTVRRMVVRVIPRRGLVSRDTSCPSG